MGAKLGLKITKSFSGFGTGFGVNESEWTKNIRDTRDDYKCIPALEDDSNASVIMYSASDTGEFFTIISSIAARPGDFVSAWIYLPSHVQIGEREMASVIDETREQILADEIDTAKLESIFVKEYAEWEIPKGCTKTNGLAYAVRYYGKGTDYQLWELLNLLSQPENANYKAIFLIDKGSGITPINCEDVTGHILRDTFRVEPPASIDGFEPFYNGVKFTRPQRVTEGEKMVVVWQKKNYADITTTSIITGENCRIQSINPSQYQKYISSNNINVFGEKGNLISDEKYTLCVNGRILEKGMRVPVSEAILKEVTVSVTNCKGYKDVKTKCDFTSNSPCPIKLKEECFTYEFTMPLRPEIKDSARVSPIIVESKYKLVRTPFEGYHSYSENMPSQGCINRIFYQPDKKPLWKRLIIPSITFVLGIVVGAFIISPTKEDNRNKDQQRTYNSRAENEGREATNQTSSVQTSNPTQETAKLLLNMEAWERSKFEECDELKGLWDELNTYNLDAILKRKDALSKSDKFKKIIEKVSELKELNYIPTEGNTYNEVNDYEIDYNRYITALTKKINNGGGAGLAADSQGTGVSSVETAREKKLVN